MKDQLSLCKTRRGDWSFSTIVSRSSLLKLVVVAVRPPIFFMMKCYMVISLVAVALASGLLGAEPRLIPLGPFGGDVRSLALHAERPDRIFLGTADGQLFLSKNGGADWEKLTPGLNRRELVIDSLVFHPDAPDVLYAGGWELKNAKGELFLTEDGGSNWRKVDLGRYQSSIRAVALASTNPDHIAIGITEGVILSRDGGGKWDRISRGYRSLYNVHSLAFRPDDENSLFAGTWRLGWQTPDLGKSWRKLQTGIYWDSHLFSIQISPENPAVVFAGACSGIYRSLDGGVRWAKLKNGLPSRAKRTRALQFDPNDAKTIYAGTTAGLYRSVNNGSSWRLLLDDVVINTVLVDPRDSRTVIVGSDDAGILKSTDYGETFLPLNEGFSQRQIGAVAVHPGSTEVFYAGVTLDRHFGGFFVSGDQGGTWTNFNEGLGKAVASIQAILPSTSSDEVFLGTGVGLFRGVPKKERWVLVDGTEGLAVGDLAVDHRRELLFLVSAGGFYELDLRKGNFRQRNIPTPDSVVTSILVDEQEDLLFLGAGDGVYRSRDKGASWQLRAKGLSGASVNTLEKSGKRLLCGTKNGLFSSDNRGESWSPSQGVFPIEIVSVEANPVSDEHVVAADLLAGHFFVSGDSGRSWEIAELGPVLSRISSFDYTSAGELLVGTFTEGIVRIVSQSDENRMASVEKESAD